MLKRIDQLFWLFLSLVLLYFVVVRVLLTWAQTAPEHFLPFVEQVTQTQIQIDSLDIEQTWLGFEFEIKGAHFRSDNAQGRLDHASGDVNLLSLLGGGLGFGEKLTLNGLVLSLAEQPLKASTETVENGFKIDQAWSILYKSWQLINLKDIQVFVPLEQRNLTVGVDSLQTYRGVQWTLGGVLTLEVEGAEKSRIQLKGSFSPPTWRDALEGHANLNVLTPILLEPFYPLMSDEWRETLPSGALLGDIDLEVKRGELAKLMIRTHAQNLVWPDNDDLLPKSFGLDLSWVATNQLSGKASENWQFQIENIRLDKVYVDTISPIYIRLDQNKRLTFQAKELDYEVIRPFAELMVRAFKYDQFGKNIQQLKLVDVSGALDIVELKLTELSLKLPKLAVDAHQNIPGFRVENLTITKNQTDFWIKSPQPISVMVNSIDKGQPLSLTLDKPVHITLDDDQSQWQLERLSFELAQIPMQLNAKGNTMGDLEMDLQLQPESLATVKRYLPYNLMSATLQSWLKTALVSGDGIQASVKIQGNIQDFPFENGQGLFVVTADVNHTHFRFQPDWPALTDFSAHLKFTPYQFVIETRDLVLNSAQDSQEAAVKAKDIRVILADLDQSDIAVQIDGKVDATATHLVDYLQKTPLLEKIGMEGFLKDQVALSGDLHVDLDEIWIPVYGYQDRSEKVKGRVVFDQVDMKLFDVFTLSQLKGQLQFTEASIQSDALSAMLFGQPASLQLSTHKNQIQLLVKGDITLNEAFLSGVSPWQSLISMPLTSAEPLTIHNEFDLTDLVFKLPAPLSEEAMIEQKNRPNTLISKMTLKDSQLKMSLHAGRLIQVQSGFDLAQQQLNHIQVSLNGQSDLKPGVRQNGSEIQGRLHFVDFDGWLKVAPILNDFWSNKWGQSATETPSIFWQKSHLKVDRLGILGAELKNIAFDWSTLLEDPLWVMAIQGDDVKATIKQQSSHQYALDLTRLNVNLPVNPLESKTEDSSCQVIQPRQEHPETKFSVDGKNIQINGKLINKLSFELTNSNDLLKVANLNVFANKVEAPFLGEYLFKKAENTSLLTGSIKTKQVDSLLAFLGFNKGFKGREMQMGVNLDWIGGLGCFMLKHLSGTARFKIEEGLIKDAEPGFARILGLLSFESLARRLKLNVNDFTEAGLVYDQIEGNGNFEQGYFVIDKLELKAPAAKAKVFGRVDLLANELDLKAEVTPSLGSSLPAIAAISGFATPIAGLAAYVFMKYMPFVNEDIVTYRYDVTGTFSNPVLDVKGPSVELFKLGKEKSPTPNGLNGLDEFE